MKKIVFLSLLALVLFSTGAQAVTTIGTNVSTGGTLSVTGATTLSSTLAVTGTSTLTGLLTVASGLDTAGATTDITLQNDETITNTTDGIITLTGQVAVSPTRIDNGSGYAYLFNLNDGGGSSSGAMTGGAATKTYAINASVNRPTASAATGDSNDSVMKLSYNNYAANDSNFIIRGINSGINNRSGGTLGILEGGSIGAQNKSGGTSPTVRGLTVTPENYGTTATEFGGIDIVMKNEGAVATTEYGLRVRNLNNSIADAVGSAILISDTGANTGWDYVLDANGASVTTAEIRLSNGEIISNTTDGTISFGAANIVTTGSLIMPTSAETLVDGADGGSSCAAANKGSIVIDAGNSFFGCDGTNWQKLDN